MSFDTLPTEILQHIFHSVPTISSALALASTCHYFHDVYHSGNKLAILYAAAEEEFGPVDDIVQLLTHNSSQPAHTHRQAPVSDALLQQILHTGRVAQRWEDIYPLKKWKTDFAERRLLSNSERRRLRRAIYRLWLFSAAFHTATHVRTCRALPEVMRERAALLHNFSTPALAEMLDVHRVLRDTVANNICPSSGKMRQKFHKRFPTEVQHSSPFLCNIHLNYHVPNPPPVYIAPNSCYHNSAAFSSGVTSTRLSRWHLDPGADGWGDDITHYYVVEDMMKLSPAQILHLRDHCPWKSQVEGYVKELGEWFGNNGETFSETLAFVVRQRSGADAEELQAAVEDGELGVAVAEDG